MRPIKFSIAAGEEETFYVAGDKVFMYTLPIDQAVTIVIEEGANNVRSYANQGTKIYAKPFKQVTLRNESAGQRTGLMLVGSGDIDVPIPSVVQVMDGTRERTKTGLSFKGYIRQAAVAAEYAHVEWFNPADSGVNMWVKSFGVRDGNGVGGSKISLDDKGSAVGTAGTGARSKYFGAAADSIIQQRTLSQGAINSGSGVVNVLWGLPDAQVERWDLKDDPFLIPPGRGMLLYNDLVNMEIRAYVEYFLEVL